MQDQLMSQIASPGNLLSAWRSIRRNIPKYRHHKASGPDGLSIKEYETDLHANLQALRHALLKNTYKPKPPGTYELQKKNGNGTRMISILSLDDRIAQKATHQVLEPIWEPCFLNCNYGFRPGKSIMDAVTQVNKYRQTGNPWLVDGDIQSFFDEIKTELLMRMIEKKIKDRQVLTLIENWLDLEKVQPSVEKPLNRIKFEPVFTTNPQKSQDRYKSFHEPPQYNYDEFLPNQTEFFEETDPFSYESSYPHYDSSNGMDIPFKQILLTNSTLLLRYLKPYLPEIKQVLQNSIRNPLVNLSITKTCLTTGGILAAAIGAGVIVYQKVNHRQLPIGIPQGSPLSPLFANIYLHYFDLPLVKKEYRLVRYADDWVICCPTEEIACRAYNDAAVALMKLGLNINREKTQILNPHKQIAFLGKTI